MKLTEDKREILLLILLAFIALYLPLGLAPLFDLDEGAFSEATREMLRGGDYITTYLNGHLRFDKPILIYWLQLFSVKLLGLNEFALRLPSAIAGTLWAGAVYIFTRKEFDYKVAFFTTLFMLSAIQVNLIAKAAIADSLLNLFIALSMFSIYRYYQERKNGYLYLTFLFMALGFLTKGPVAILIPFVVSEVFFAIKGEWSLWLRAIFNPKGLALFAIIALPWYILEYQAQGMAFIKGFFFKHNLHRFEASMEQHIGGWYYYIVVIFLGLLPFSFVILKAFGSVKKWLKDDLMLYLLLWFGFVFIFFSLSGTKLPHYVIYGYTPLFIFVGVVLNRGVSKSWVLIPSLTLLVLLLFLPEIVIALKTHIKDQMIQILIPNIYDSFGLLYHTILAIAVLILLLILFKKVSPKLTWIVTAFVFVIVVNYAVLFSYGNLMQAPIKEAGLLAKKYHYKVKIYHLARVPSFNLYYDSLVSEEKPKAGDIIFTKVSSLKDFSNYKILYKKNAFTLIRLEP